MNDGPFVLLKEPKPGDGFLAILYRSTITPRRFPTIAEALAYAEAEPDFQAAAYKIVTLEEYHRRSITGGAVFAQ